MNKNIYELSFDIDQYYETENKDMLVEKKDMKFNMKGIYIGKHTWHRDSSESDQILETLVKDKIDWTTVKTLYRYPHLSLSRDKVSLLKDKYCTTVGIIMQQIFNK